MPIAFAGSNTLKKNLGAFLIKNTVELKEDLQMSKKIIQIIPAPSNLIAVYNYDGKMSYIETLCLALTDDGEILVMNMDDDGQTGVAVHDADFKRFKWIHER